MVTFMLQEDSMGYNFYINLLYCISQLVLHILSVGFFICYLAKTSYTQRNYDDARFVLDKHAYLDRYNASTLAQ